MPRMPRGAERHDARLSQLLQELQKAVRRREEVLLEAERYRICAEESFAKDVRDGRSYEI